MSNTFGKIYKISTYGESHGKAIGVIIDGCPSGIEVNEKDIQKELDRRKPGQSKITTQRKEDDNIEILSGIFNGKTTGSPISLIIKNKDQKSSDYNHISTSFRPSHADFTYHKKYKNRDHRGGGRSSARETANWVAAGAISKKILQDLKITIHAYVSKVGKLELNKTYNELDFDNTENNIVRCPDNKFAEKFISIIDDARKNRDTVGGVITCVIKGCPIGIGEPIFRKLHAELGMAMLSINAVKGFEYGSGFKGVEMFGSEHNDEFQIKSGKISTKSNNSGGIQGGISNGEDIYFNVAFKPVSTIMKDQDSIDSNNKNTIIKGKGRHDPCVVPRAVPIVESMASNVLVDLYLQSKK
ncbi:MAG: chorismate synthase [Cytophagales bacterium]|jgi:chorismate synthase|nr:chorismate synthase [Cytophagales bacterium]